MYYIYNKGLGEGKLKCTVSVFCDFTNYWFVYTKMEYPDGRKVRIRNRNILTKEVVIVGALGQILCSHIKFKGMRKVAFALHASCLLKMATGH